MNIDRALKHRSSLESRLRDMFGIARICKMGSAELHQRTLEIFGGLPKGIPEWVYAYGKGYAAAAVDDLYRNHLEFCYMYKGELYSTYKESTHLKTEVFYESSMGHVLCDCPSGHYWQGSDKAFAVGPAANARPV